MDAPGVSGAILVDMRSGLSLGVLGRAREDDAPQLAVASRAACDAEGVGVVSLHGARVVLRRGDDVLVGVYRDS